MMKIKMDDLTNEVKSINFNGAHIERDIAGAYIYTPIILEDG